MTPQPPRQRARGRHWLEAIGLTLVVMVLVRTFLVQSFWVPSGSMEPTIRPGDRVLVNRLARGGSIQRGDVVVFDGATAFAAGGGDTGGQGAGPGGVTRTLRSMASMLSIDTGTDYVKRVVGVPGDRVVCCADSGRLLVNGSPVTEPYLFPGDRPSELTFDVTVPAGRIWVMGDHRGDSSDSRAYLGRPGGGMVALDDVIGRATVRYWPLDRLGSLGDVTPLSAVPSSTLRSWP